MGLVARGLLQAALCAPWVFALHLGIGALVSSRLFVPRALQTVTVFESTVERGQRPACQSKYIAVRSTALRGDVAGPRPLVV